MAASARPARLYQRAKNGVHALQALIIFIGAVITIAIFTKPGASDGRIKYYFAMCWLCIPVLVYQTAFPTFERTRKFANAYAHAILDTVCTVLWFAAFIAVIVWVKQGSHAAKGWKDGDSLCDKFAWGSVVKCKLGQAITVLAAMLCMLFVLTTIFSIYGVSFFRSNGSLPGIPTKDPEHLPLEDEEDKYNFSSTHHDQFDRQEETQSMRPNQTDADDCFSAHSDMEAGAHSPSVTAGEGFDPVDTSHYGAYDPLRQPSPQDPFRNRSISPHYNTTQVNENGFLGGLKPLPVQTRRDPFRDDLALTHGHEEHGNSAGTIGFPEADYHR